MSSPKDRTVGDVLKTFSDKELKTLYMCVGSEIEGLSLSPDEKSRAILIRENLNDEQKKVFDYLIDCALEYHQKLEGITIVKEID